MVKISKPYSNFIKEIVKIGKEAQKALNPRLSRDLKSVFVEDGGESYYGGAVSVYDSKHEFAGDLWRVDIIHPLLTTPTEKVKYRIQCNFHDKNSIKRGGWEPYTIKMIDVSKNEKYSKEEIEKAKKSVIAKILEEFDKASRKSFLDL